MILKILDYRKGEHENHRFEEWTYLDNIVSASCYFNEGSKSTCACCTFRDESVVTFSIPYVAFLMSDVGKTIDRIEGVVDSDGDKEGCYETLQEAAIAAMKESIS